MLPSQTGRRSSDTPAILELCVPVPRKYDRDILAPFFQRRGQRPDHVRQPAGLDERHRFGSHHEDLAHLYQFSPLAPRPHNLVLRPMA